MTKRDGIQTLFRGAFRLCLYAYCRCPVSKLWNKLRRFASRECDASFVGTLAFPLEGKVSAARLTDEVFLNRGASRNLVPCREQACLFRLRQIKNTLQITKDSLDLNIRAVFSAFNIKLVPSMRNGQGFFRGVATLCRYICCCSPTGSCVKNRGRRNRQPLSQRER